MQKIALAASVAFMALCVSSCKDKKEDPEPKPEPVVYDNYTKLAVGNYWIYQLYNVDSTGNGPALNEFDSVYIVRDSVVNNNTYYCMESTISYEENIWVRDSLHYLVDVYGNIRFSSQDFTTAFKSQPFMLNPQQGDTAAWVTYKMANKDALFATPAGTFATSDFQIIFDMYPGYNGAGTHRVRHTRYAKDIGIISQTLPYYIDNPKYVERRLLRYYLN